jgi:hypothetical protein
VLEQAVDRGDGGVGLARAGGHLHQGARTGGLERGFQIGDRGFLAVAQAEFGGGALLRVERGNVLQASAQAAPFGQPFAQRFRTVEAEDFT